MAMTTRFYWMSDQTKIGSRTTAEIVSSGVPAENKSRYLVALLTLSSLTAIFVIWIGYRWLVQPAWLLVLPLLIHEAIALGQLASFITLVVLWTILIWRQRSRKSTLKFQILNVAELYSLSPKAFERYVASLFRQKGHRVHLRGRTGDHGVDLELFGPNGRRAIVQCKRYQNTVGEETVRDLYGTLIHEQVSRAFLVTTAEISDAARVWAEGKPITLIDGETLVQISTSIEKGL
jgi:HJR/Mrr/RecB family endonuclease